MNEKTLINSTMAVMFAPFVDGWQQLAGWLIFAIVLILADLNFGIKAAKVRGETIRRSRAIRRSVGKLVDYICWIAIAWVMGPTLATPLNIPLLPLLTMIGVYVVELQSIADNYFEYKGVKKRINIFKLIVSFFKKPDINNAIEDKK